MRRAWWLVALLFGCAAGPDPIHPGTDTCARCGMIISEARTAGESIRGGTVRKYDSLDELQADAPPDSDWYVADYQSGELLPLSKATLLRFATPKFPMGGTTIAFRSPQEAQSFAKRYPSDPGVVVTPQQWGKR